MKRLILTGALGLSLLASAAAVASNGYVVNSVNLRSGPDEGYPSVGMLNAGAPVVLESCVSGWSWCDVSTPDGRGWIPGSYLQEDYQGQRVFVPEYGERIGIPFVAFDFNTYWSTYYRDRPWYGERERYGLIRPMYRPITIDINLRSQSSHGPARDEHGHDDAWRDKQHDDGHGHDQPPRDGYGGGPNNNVEPRRPHTATTPPEKDATHPQVADQKPPQRSGEEPKAKPKSSPDQDNGKDDPRDSNDH